MGDLKSKNLIVVKGILFLAAGLGSATLLMIEHASLANLFLLAVAIWSFCRVYYFAFYVLENYVDPEFRYSGIYSLLAYIVSNKHRSNARR